MTIADRKERDQALDLNHNYLVRAPAGSGKTGLLVQRVLAALAVVRQPEAVLAMTFTNKAAAEIRERVLEALALAAGERPDDVHSAKTWALGRKVLERDREAGWDLAKNPSRIRALTMDKLNSILAGLMPLLSGMGGPMEVTDDPNALYQQACLDLFAGIESDAMDAEDRAALERLLAYADNRYDRLFPFLCGLLAKREQWLAYAFAGTNQDIEALFGNPLREMVQTAIAQCIDLVGQQRLATALSAARAAEPLVQGLPEHLSPDSDSAGWRALAGVFLTARGDLRKKVDARTGFKAGTPHAAVMNEVLAELRDSGQEDAIADALFRVASAPDPDTQALDEAFLSAMTRVLVLATAQLRVVFVNAGKVDFAEISMRALSAVNGSSDNVDALAALDYTVEHILVDEMQDTSTSQVELLLSLVDAWVPGDGRSLFMVGDPQQSIYGFRQAEVRLFLELWEKKAFGQLPLQTLTLTSNFRSQSGLVDWVNTALEPAFPAVTDAYAGEERFSASVPALGDKGGAVRSLVRADWTREEEFESVAADVKATLSENPGASVAVLGRSRVVLKGAVTALEATGIRCASQDVDDLTSRGCVKDVAAIARALWHDHDRLSWVELLHCPLVGMSWADITALVAGRQDLSVRDCLSSIGTAGGMSDEGRERGQRVLSVIHGVLRDPASMGDWTACTRAVWMQLGGLSECSVLERGEVERVFSLMVKLAEGGWPSRIEQFNEGLARLYASPAGGDVQVMTIHKSKGLEFDYVYLVGLGELSKPETKPLLHYRTVPRGFLLAAKPERDVERDDANARLFERVHKDHVRAIEAETLRQVYVGVTRARHGLVLSGRAGADGEPARGSLLALVRHAVDVLAAPDRDQKQQSAAVKAAGSAPMVARVPVSHGYATAPADLAYHAPRDVRYTPSESTVTQYDDDRREKDALARLVGTMYHAALERILTDGPEGWAVPLDDERVGAMKAGFRRNGLPEPLIDIAVGDVEELIGRTLDGDAGRVVLGGVTERHVERRMAGFLDGAWVAAQIDLSYVDDGAVYLIDHKTAGLDVPTSEAEAFAGKAAAEYKPQLDKYKALLRAAGETRPIHKRLFMPALDMLVAVQ